VGEDAEEEGDVVGIVGGEEGVEEGIGPSDPGLIERR
jgi:hypothetical protein